MVRCRIAILCALLGFIVYNLYSSADNPVVYAQSDKVERKVTAVTSHVEVHTIQTQRPDGTKVTETTTVTDTTKVSEATAEQHTTASAAAPKSKYRVGVDYLPSLDAPKPTDIGIRAAARLGESNVWLEGGADVKHRQLSIGISAEF